MELTAINKRIEELLPELLIEKEVYNNFMNVYAVREAQITMMEENVGLKNAEMRNAAITLTLQTEGLIDLKQKYSNNYYRIKTELDYLDILSKNLRVILTEDK